MHGKRDNLHTTFWAIASSNPRELLSTFPAALAGYLLCQGRCVSWLRPDFFDLLHQPAEEALREPDSSKLARLFFHAPKLSRSAIAHAADLVNGRAKANALPNKLFILDLSTSLSQAALDLFLAADKRLYLLELDQNSSRHAQRFFDNLMQRLVEWGFTQGRGPSTEPAIGRLVGDPGSGSNKQTGQQDQPLHIEMLGLFKTGQAIDAADFANLHKKLQTSLPGLDLIGIQEADADFAAWFSVLEKYYNQIEPQDGLRLVAHIAKRLATSMSIDCRNNSAATNFSKAFPFQLIHRQLVLDLEPK